MIDVPPRNGCVITQFRRVLTLPLDFMRAVRLNFCWLLILAVSWLACVSGCDKAPPPITKRTIIIPAAIVKQLEEQAVLDKNLEEARKRLKELTPPESTEPQRMLAALVPQPDTDFFWTFKVQGKPEELEKIKPEFLKLLGSLHWFTNEGKLQEWKLPEGWKSVDQEDQFGRVATITLPDELAHIKIAVAKFKSTADWLDSALVNLNRWRGQLQTRAVDH